MSVVVYVVSNDEAVVRQAILDMPGAPAVASEGDALHLRDERPGEKIFVVEVREYK